MNIESNHFLITALEFMSVLFIFVLGMVLLAVVVIFILDVSQTRHAIRRNFPVIGRFRYFFERLGVFFRQYFFAMDREELPFNRAERAWVYQAAKNEKTTAAFGSTRDLKLQGTVLFVNHPYPRLSQDMALPQNISIGPDCSAPFHTTSLFNISAMSYGSISRPAVMALSSGAHQAGCWLNTGEGGLSPHHLHGGADLVFQIGTAKYGVRNAVGSLDDGCLRDMSRIEQVHMFELKLSQGAKPGKGGILPGGKVTSEVANIRGITPGKDSISPNRHPDIDNEEELLDRVDHIRQVSGKPAGIKFVLGDPAWLDDLFNAINRRGTLSAPDFITLDSADGGSGAAPMSLMDYMGMPIQESLPLLVDRLHAHGLKERIKVVVSGKLVTPGQVAWALCMGADFINSARGFMFALGCIQAMQCNRNTCPTGITTHNPRLQKGLDPVNKAQRVANYVNNMVKEVGIIAHACGVNEPRQLTRHHARIVTDQGFSVPLDQYETLLHRHKQ